MTTHRHQRTVLLTGASRGLGAAMAEHLVAAGCTVFAASRRPCPDGAGIPVRMDVTDADSVRRAVAVVGEHLGSAGLDALVNNAAVLHAGSLATTTAATVDEQLRTNVGGLVAVTQACLPLLERDGGRIVNVSSINARLALPYWSVYSATKAAVEALSDAWRLELAGCGVAVTTLTLGAFVTDIRRAGLDAWAADDPDDPALARLRSLVDGLDATATDPSVAARAVVELVTTPELPSHAAAGDGIEDLLALAAQPPAVRDAALAQLLGQPA